MYAYCVFSVAAPSVPVDLALVDKGPTYIVLNWTSPDPLLTGLPPAEGYLISSTNGILDYVLTNTSVNVSSLSPLTTYTFMVSANNSYGTSKFSLPVTMTTLEGAMCTILLPARMLQLHIYVFRVFPLD